ncbi:MAG: ABC transporter ATP-binding protein [Firmicutes bacterium]|nr:ABC transporter ATP-binding protein [Bacillota bacterium]
MENVLEIKGLTKRYDGFTLDNVNLALPKGNIMGFIGENGAGKSTTIKLILNVIHRDSGEVKVFGRDNIEYENEIKENIGVVYDESNFPDTLNAGNINTIMKNIYKNWDQDAFDHYLKKFSLPRKKDIKSFSRGMKMKLAIATALSHQAKLLILDEPTSGLDPIIRDEILDIFLDFIQDEEHSIFLSTHITSDIEKIADYIAFIHQGKIVFVESKDVLLDTYGVLKCRTSEFDALDKTFVKGYRKNKFGVEALVEKHKLKEQYTIDHASIEDIMLFTVRGRSIERIDN